MKIAIFFLLITVGAVSAQNQHHSFDNDFKNPCFMGNHEEINNGHPEFYPDENFRQDETVLKSTNVQPDSGKKYPRNYLRLKSGIIRNNTKIPLLSRSFNQNNTSLERIKIDKHINYYNPVKVFTYDSLNTDIYEYKYDEKGFVIEKIQKKLNLQSNLLEYATKSKYIRNERGILLERSDFKWDAETWQNSNKYVYDYDENGKEISSKSYDWNSNDKIWLLKNKTLSLYNNNQLLSREYYGDDGVVKSKTEYTYNEIGKQTSYLFCDRWDPTKNTWEFQNRTATKYNEKGEKISFESWNFDISTFTWKYYYKTIYDYYSDGIRKESNYQSNSQDNNLELVSQIFYKTETIVEGNKSQEIIWKKNSENKEWKQFTKKELVYNQLGSLISDKEYTYNTFNHNWEEWLLLLSRTYSERGQILLFENYKYGSEKGSDKYENQYDEEGKRVAYKQYKWNTEENMWQLDYKYITKYYPGLGYESNYYTYQIKGFKTEWQNYGSPIVYSYDPKIGKYTGYEFEEDNYNDNIQIRYNKNLKIDESVIIYDGEEVAKIKYYYDTMQRDSLWVFLFKNDDGVWAYDESSYAFAYNYEKMNNDSLIITEYFIDKYYSENNSYDPWGLHYFYKGQIQSYKYFGKTEATGDWERSVSYKYNDKGQITSETYEFDDYVGIKKYSLKGDTLYVEYKSSNTGALERIDIIIVDTNYSSHDIQVIPLALLYEDPRGLFESYGDEFFLMFTYGKVISLSSYDVDEDGNLLFGSKEEYFYSPASILSGDGIVSGYIHEEITGNKSIAIGNHLDGNPVEGAIVSLLTKNNNFFLANDTTSSTGYYEFKGIPDGEYYLKVGLAGFNQVSTYNLKLFPYSNSYQSKNFVVQNGELFTNLNELENEVKIYPNPASDYIDMVSSAEITSVKIFNSSGQLQLIQEPGKSQLKKIPIRGFSRGIYFIEVKTKTKNFRQKLIVN